MADAKGKGISGLAVFMATAGGFLLFVGVRNVPVLEGLRKILKGEVPEGRSPEKTPTPDTLQPSKAGGFADADGSGAGLFGGGGGSGGGGGAGDAGIAAAAAKYLGIPYVWGGATPAGFDCSGLVTWVLVKDLGYTNLPSQSHTVTTQFLAWNGAKTVPRDQCRAGDLVCWFGHIGIATGQNEMIHAPQPGEVVKRGTIWNTPAPQIRRVNPK